MEPFEVHAELRRADVRAALVRTMSRHSPGLRFLPLFYGGAVAVPVAAVVLGLRGHAWTLPQLMFVALSLLFVVSVPLGIERAVQGFFRPGFDPRAVWRFSASSLQLRSGEHVTTVERASIFDSLETPARFLVHPKQSSFLVLPKRGLDPSQVEAVRAWLAAAPRRDRAVSLIGWASPSIGLLLVLGALLLYHWLGG